MKYNSKYLIGDKVLILNQKYFGYNGCIKDMIYSYHEDMYRYLIQFNDGSFQIFLDNEIERLLNDKQRYYNLY